MRVSTLYILLVAAVLWSGCGSEEAETDAVSRRPAARERDSERLQRSPESGDVILFLGNSLSAGAGVDPEEAFPSLIRQRIDSLGWDFRVVNAGVSGETSSGGLSRIDWLLQEPISILVLELGGNDGLRGIPIDVTRKNLARIIERTRAKYPEAEIVLAGMQIPPNLGHEYTNKFRDIYPSLAEEYDTHLIPFLLENVGGVDSLMQSDGIHPTAEGHRIVARNVWEVLRGVLEEARAQTA